MAEATENTPNIIAHHYRITRTEREAKNGHKAACFWFTGLSGSGKSTLANIIEQRFFGMGIHTYILDGDNTRKGLNKDLNFTEEGRLENIRRTGEVAKLMCDAGIVVFAAFVSPFRKDRQMLRELIKEGFYEIFVDAPLEVCEKRDVKGFYKRARLGEIENFTGISSPFEPPLSPEVRVRTDKQSVESAAKQVTDALLPKIKI